MKLYGGIDLHSNNCVVVVLDEEERVVYEKRLPNDLGYLLLELAPYRGRVDGVVVESTSALTHVPGASRKQGIRSDRKKVCRTKVRH
jgi:hypothetical protein